MQCCTEEAKSILKPIFDEYFKQFETRNFEKAAEYYDPDAAVVEVEKKGTYGREAIKQGFFEFAKLMGETTTKAMKETYQMTGDYIIVTGEYETSSEKMGTIKGTFTQIWRKAKDTYLILHEEYAM
ncbi:hypothetical protein ANCCAN_06338 [Ancylostoma caninum]|uniref:DUF4440 domain-containing protein n=1 Tax=Ancylostoma caninum TaxID=29170 RepID=A0A368GX37_ANCCA|nr:hypothetical protein ANCCAN_06338 [Ancylostoma caninum]